MPRMGALAGTVADVMEPIDQVLTIIPVMLRCEVATSHYQVSYYSEICWFILLAIKKEHEVLKNWKPEMMRCLCQSFLVMSLNFQDWMISSCVWNWGKGWKGSDNQNVCSLENGTMTWWATGCWQGETHPPASYSILQCDDVISVVFTLRTCLNKDWPSEHVRSFRLRSLRSPKHVAAGAEAPSGLHHEGFAEGLGKPAGVCGAPGAPS